MSASSSKWNVTGSLNGTAIHVYPRNDSGYSTARRDNSGDPLHPEQISCVYHADTYSNECEPIVRDANHFLHAFGGEDVHYVARHGVHPEGVEIERLCSTSGPQQVRRQDTISQWLEVGDLFVPVVRSGREAVHEEQGGLALGRRRVVIPVYETSLDSHFLV